jgi:hypothetical protein
MYLPTAINQMVGHRFVGLCSEIMDRLQLDCFFTTRCKEKLEKVQS